jgi:hypothetical protein
VFEDGVGLRSDFTGEEILPILLSAQGLQGHFKKERQGANRQGRFLLDLPAVEKMCPCRDAM